ncbi:MAG: efflux RND transporter permease subunit [Acidobacteriota bacterium]|nr:efflux RND transporter permease subunit [Acidobacteriota bacterium]
MSIRTGPAGRSAGFFIDSELTPLLVVAALALGAFAVSLTPREEEPQIVLPVFDLFVGLPGADPLEVESRVTIPLEKRMWEVPGVEYVYSQSLQGSALVTARFYVGEDVEQSLVRLYEKISSGLDLIPAGATFPLIKQRTIDDVPIVALTLWSRNHDGFALRRVAAELRRELAALTDVSKIDLIGGQRREVRVVLDAQRMAALGVDPSGIASALSGQNASVPAGSFQDRDREVLVETGVFLSSAEEVHDLVVGLNDGRPVYLRQVADVLDGPEEPEEYSFFVPGAAAASRGIVGSPGADATAPAVTLSISKRKGADATRVVGRVRARVDSLRGRLIPDGIETTVTRDYGHTADEKASELLTHLFVAIASVTVVIALFLGWRGGLVVFISVPVTFALTLFVYYLFDYTLNRVTLFALIFVTGIVVDDSIIVVENIVRHFAMGVKRPLDAAIESVAEVGNPTILATLTVIAAVLPMAFVRGLMGPYMKPMPIGATLAMSFSLIVALVVAPWFAYRLLRGSRDGDAEYRLEATLVYRFYRALIVPLLGRPLLAWTSIGVVGLLLLAAMALFPLKLVTVKMLPFDNKSELQIIVDMPEGTSLERTASVARELASTLATVEEVTDIQIYVGSSAPVNFNGLVRHYDLRKGPHVADLQVNLLPKSERRRQSHDVARAIRPRVEALAGTHGASVKIAEVPPGPPVLSTLVAEVYGPDDESRLELARAVRRIFEETDGVVDVDWLVEAAQDKRLVRVDREKAARHGVTTVAAARAVRAALGGEVAGVLHDANEAEEVSIRIRLPREERSSVSDVIAVRVASRSGALVPLSELVTVETTTQPMSRQRKNLEPVVYVTGDVAGVQESPVYAILAMSERIDELRLADGARVEQHYRAQPETDAAATMKWDGEWHITYEVFRDLGAAFAAVLVLIYVLIVGWFRSFRVPLTMMIAIPLSLIGILPGHWLFGAFFTATSMIGFIALAGIMVRNSVLLIDFVELAVARGRTLGEAVVEAGAVRFRPILLTAGTVVVGATVILFDPIFQGLAISLMFGALASTALTLVVVPLVHFMAERRRHERPLPEAWSVPGRGAASVTRRSGTP